MQKQNKIVVVSQHYPPDNSTTAAILRTIAERLAVDASVLVLSGASGFGVSELAGLGKPIVVEIRNWIPEKAKLFRRATAEFQFTMRVFVALLVKLHHGDVVLTVTAPFLLPYAVVTAAKLKQARSVLIMHDLFPDVLVVSGLLRSTSIVAKAIRAANSLMFRALDSVVVIGRDTECLLSRHGKWLRRKISYIPNWATLTPGVRVTAADNPYRCQARFVVGLSGNLGFTHDPQVVFDAARLLQDDLNIHFLLSGWGMGFEQLKTIQSEARLVNVTLVERVPEEDLELFLSAADIWVIPYRRNVAGVSVPSRFYNLLAVGRPVVIISEPDGEAALTVTENNLGWVVAPGNAFELAKSLRDASLSQDSSRAERAVAVAARFSLDRAMTSYASLINAMLSDARAGGS